MSEKHKNTKLLFSILAILIIVNCASLDNASSWFGFSSGAEFPSASTPPPIPQLLTHTVEQYQKTPSQTIPPTTTPRATTPTPTTDLTHLPTITMPCYPGPANFNAKFIRSRVIMDGDVHAWYASFHEVSNIVSGKDRWAGDWDLSNNFQLGWTKDNFYVIVRVTDERYRQSVQDPAKTYLGDSIEVLIDTDLCTDLKDTEMNEDDFHFRISPGYNHVKGDRYVYRVKPTPAEEILQITVATDRTDEEVTNYEVQIPWEVLGVSDPQAGLIFRFALLISDNDDPESNLQETVMSTTLKPLDGSLDPTAWTVLILRD